MAAKFREIEKPLIWQGQELSVPLENIKNNSDYTTNNVIVSVGVPPGVIYTRSNLPRGTYDSNSNIWDIGAMASQEILFGELIFTVIDDCKAPFKFTYTVGTTGACADPNTSDNSACVLISGLSCCAISQHCGSSLAVDDQFVVPKEKIYPFAVQGNDLDCSVGTTRTFQWLTQPYNGSITGTPDNASYIPNQGFCGVDYATYGLYCNGILRGTATVIFNVTCAHPTSDVFATGVDTPLVASVSPNDLPCINGGITSYILATNPLANTAGLSEPTSQTEVKVTSWSQLDGAFTVTPSGGFTGTATFQYYIECKDPLTGMTWNSNPVTVSVGVPSAFAAPQSGAPCSGNVLLFASPCIAGVTTVELTAASEVNCTATVLPSGAYTVAITNIFQAWEFGYTILCDGVPTDTGTITGGPVTAYAHTDIVVTTGATQHTVNLGDNDNLCSEGITSYQLVGGSETNVVIDEFNPITGEVSFTPQAIGDWEFQYRLVCNLCNTVQVSNIGTVQGTVPASSSNAPPSSSTPPPSSSTPPPSSSTPPPSSSGV